MSHERPLYGACNCGRNSYLVIIPENASSAAELFVDTERTQAAPTAWLRVPLSWYQSHTTSFFPDETHTSIRKTFTPEHQPHTKRNFCGICGTHLSYWTEQPAEEAEYMSVTVGSLRGDGFRALEELGLLPEDNVFIAATGEHHGGDSAVAQSDGSSSRLVVRQGTTGDLSWVEESMDGSGRGKTRKTRRGMGLSADGNTTVEWEVSEYHEGDSEPEGTTGRGKRKLGDVGAGEDIDMKP